MFFYFYRKSGNFRKSIIAAFLVAFVLSSGPLDSSAKDADGFTASSQPQTTRSARNRNLFSSGARKPSNGGPGKPDNSGSGGDDDKGIPQYSKPETVKTTEERIENIDEHIYQMNEISESENEEEQCETTEQFQVDESYKSNSALKKVTAKVRKNDDVLKDVKNVKKALAEGADPMKIGRKPTDLGNGFYYIRKPDARIVVKLDRTTGNSDIVAVAIRSNDKSMKTLATVVNSQCDTKIKINPNAY